MKKTIIIGVIFLISIISVLAQTGISNAQFIINCIPEVSSFQSIGHSQYCTYTNKGVSIASKDIAYCFNEPIKKNVLSIQEFKDNNTLYTGVTTNYEDIRVLEKTKCYYINGITLKPGESKTIWFNYDSMNGTKWDTLIMDVKSGIVELKLDPFYDNTHYEIGTNRSSNYHWDIGVDELDHQGFLNAFNISLSLGGGGTIYNTFFVDDFEDFNNASQWVLGAGAWTNNATPLHAFEGSMKYELNMSGNGVIVYRNTSIPDSVSDILIFDMYIAKNTSGGSIGHNIGVADSSTVLTLQHAVIYQLGNTGTNPYFYWYNRSNEVQNVKIYGVNIQPEIYQLYRISVNMRDNMTKGDIINISDGTILNSSGWKNSSWINVSHLAIYQGVGGGFVDGDFTYIDNISVKNEYISSNYSTGYFLSKNISIPVLTNNIDIELQGSSNIAINITLDGNESNNVYLNESNLTKTGSLYNGTINFNTPTITNNILKYKLFLLGNESYIYNMSLDFGSPKATIYTYVYDLVRGTCYPIPYILTMINKNPLGNNYSVSITGNCTGGIISMPILWTDTGVYDVNISTGSSYVEYTAYNMSFISNLTVLNSPMMSYDARLNITALDRIGNTVYNFSIMVLWGNWTHNTTTTTGLVEVNLTKDLNYTVFIMPQEYAYKNRSVFVENISQNYQFNVSYNYSTDINFKDSYTYATVLQNITFQYIGPVSGTINTITGNISLLLSNGTFTFRYSSLDYPEKFYVHNVQSTEDQILTLYMTNGSQTDSTNVTITVLDEYAELVENAIVNAYKYDIGSNAYLLDERASTNYNGIVNMNLVLNTEYYKFIVEYPIGTIVRETSPTYLYTNSLSITIVKGVGPGRTFEIQEGIIYSLTYDNTTNNFRLYYQDPTNTISNACLYVYKLTSSNGSKIYNYTCNTGTTGIFYVGILNSTGSTYRAIAYVNVPGASSHYLAELWQSFDLGSVFGSFGILIAILLLIISVFIGAYNINFGIISFCVMLILVRVVNLIDIGYQYILPLCFVGIILLFILSKNEQ